MRRRQPRMRRLPLVAVGAMALFALSGCIESGTASDSNTVAMIRTSVASAETSDAWVSKISSAPDGST